MSQFAVTRSARVVLLAAASLLGAAASASAHDFWIQPASFRPETGTLLPVQLLVGDSGIGQPVAREDDHILRFVLVGADGERPIVGQDGGLPAGFVRLAPPDFRIAGAAAASGPTGASGAPGETGALVGLAVLGYRSKHARVELEPAKFEEYARLEGLEPILALRAERNQSALPSKEAYSRCAKALVAIRPHAAGGADGTDGAAAGGADRVLGFTLELVAEDNPCALAGTDSGAPQPLHVRLEFEGQPLAGALVRATPLPHAPRADDPPAAFGAPSPQPLRVRTDADGHVTLPLPNGGGWLITSVHMRPAPAGIEGVSDVDWESFWASLTFEVPASEAPASELPAAGTANG